MRKRVKFTSFDSYCVYNMLCLIFRINPRVLIERKILEAISRKNRGLTKPRRTDENKPNDRKAMHHAAQPCCSHRGHARSGAWPCMRQCVCYCVGAWPAMRWGTVVHSPGPHSFVIFRPLYIVFSSYFGRTSWLGFHKRQVGFRYLQKSH